MKGSSHLGFQKSKTLKGTMTQGNSQVVQIQKFLPKPWEKGSSKEERQKKRFQLVWKLRSVLAKFTIALSLFQVLSTGELGFGVAPGFSVWTLWGASATSTGCLFPWVLLWYLLLILRCVCQECGRKNEDLASLPYQPFKQKKDTNHKKKDQQRESGTHLQPPCPPHQQHPLSPTPGCLFLQNALHPGSMLYSHQ